MGFGADNHPKHIARQDRQRDAQRQEPGKRTSEHATRQRQPSTQTHAYRPNDLGEICSAVPHSRAGNEARARKAGYNATDSVNAACGSPNRAQAAR